VRRILAAAAFVLASVAAPSDALTWHPHLIVGGEARTTSDEGTIDHLAAVDGGGPGVGLVVYRPPVSAGGAPVTVFLTCLSVAGGVEEDHVLHASGITMAGERFYVTAGKTGFPGCCWPDGVGISFAPDPQVPCGAPGHMHAIEGVFLFVPPSP
jgi:hypothetical protein